MAHFAWRERRNLYYNYPSGILKLGKDGGPDPLFSIPASPYPEVAIDGEGRIYVGVAGQPLKRYLPNGTFDRIVLDASYGHSFVKAFGPDGKLYIQKQPVTGSLGQSSILRLNADLTIDGTWSEAMGIKGPLSVFPDGRVFGVRDEFHGSLVLLHPDGTEDRQFNVSLRGYIERIEAVNATDVYVSGDSFYHDREMAPSLVRLSIIAPDAIYFSSVEYRAYYDQPVVEVKLKRGGSLNGPATVRVNTENETARSGVHYTTFNADVTFAAGEAEKIVPIQLVGSPIAQAVSFLVQVTGDGVLPNKPPRTKVVLEPVPPGDFVTDLRFPAASTSGQASQIWFSRAAAVQPGRGILGVAFVPGVGDVLVRYQFNGEIDPSFAGSRFHATNSIRRLDIVHGKIFVRGDFWYGYYRPLLEDGRANDQFTSAIPFSTAPAVTEAPDGDIYMAGRSQWPNVTVARLNIDGSIDPAFTPATFSTGETGSHISDVAVQSTGKVLVSGDWLKRFHPDGTADASFQDPLPNKHISDIALQPDDKILVAGGFTSIGGRAAPGLARLNADGTVDTSFDPFLESGAWVYSVVALDDGSILVGGSFQGKIKKLAANGGVIGSFTIVMPNGTVHDIGVQDSENIIIAGEFTSPGNTRGLARLTTRRSPQPLLRISSSGAGYPLSVQGTAGTRLELHWSPDLTQWSSFFETNVGSTNIQIVLPYSPEAPRRFYRARQQ